MIRDSHSQHMDEILHRLETIVENEEAGDVTMLAAALLASSLSGRSAEIRQKLYPDLMAFIEKTAREIADAHAINDGVPS
jgi:hypothetical protein